MAKIISKRRVNSLEKSGANVIVKKKETEKEDVPVPIQVLVPPVDFKPLIAQLAKMMSLNKLDIRDIVKAVSGIEIKAPEVVVMPSKVAPVKDVDVTNIKHGENGRISDLKMIFNR